MGGYARYEPASGNNVVHLDDPAAAMVTDGGQSRRRRGVFLSLRTLAVAAAVALLLLLLAALAGSLLTSCSTGEKPAGNATAGDGTSQRKMSEMNLRLPTDVMPVHYRLTLAPYIYSGNPSEFFFSGNVTILIVAQREAASVRLHADRISLNASSVRIRSLNRSQEVPIKSIEYSMVAQWYEIVPQQPLQRDGHYELEIVRFSKPLLLDLRGLYLSQYKEGNEMKYLATSQLQPTDARKTFPCFDEPSFKASFDVSLVRRSDFSSISNMESKEVKTIDPKFWFPNADTDVKWQKETFHTSPKMSTYLLAFIVSQFNCSQDKDSKGRLYRNWARPEFVNITNYAMTAVKNVTEYFENYFEVKFPLNKTDQAALPDFNAGGMENWGLIAYRESRLLFDPEKDTTMSKQYVGNVITHEVAHMWFGNLVTPQWWDDIWLNEGFASFSQVLGVRHLHPDWDADAQFVTGSQRLAFFVDSKGSSHPIYIEVHNPNQITEIFDYITYRKAATVLRMLYYIVGDQTFKKAIGSYLKNNSYSSTFHTSLYDSLTREARRNNYNIDVGEIMDRWIKQMGYPVVNCTRKGDTLLLTQNHFLSDPTQKPDPKFQSEYNYTWIIPITMGTFENISKVKDPNMKDVADLIQWMPLKSQSFEAPKSKFYLLNLLSAGFYRVNYDKANWEAVTQQLLTDHSVFTPQDKARLIDDSFSLASAGYIDYSVPLNLTKYLGNETHHVPWRAALAELLQVYTMLNRQSEEFGPFSDYVRNLLRPVYKSVGLKQMKNDSHLKRLQRSLIVGAACMYGLKECQEEAQKLFKQFIDSNFTKHIPPDIRRRVLCQGIASSRMDEWQALYNRGRIDTHPGIQNDILRALACSSEPWILNTYLKYALDDSKVRRQDAALVFTSVAANPNGLSIVWDYIRDHWDTIQERVPGSFTTSNFIAALSNFNTRQKLEEMLRFKEKYKEKLGSAERAMDQTLESVRLNIRWMDSNIGVVRRWLEEYAAQRSL